MLKRKIESQFIEWKNTENHNPLIVKGCRQCGKTYSVLDFAKKNYKNVVYLNFFENPDFANVFSDSLEVNHIVMMLSALLGKNAVFEEYNTILILDEIQECPEARTALKFFKLDGRFDVIGTGSLLGVKGYGKEPKSIPVGYETIIDMYPLDFEEFLWANNYGENAISELYNHFLNQQSLSEEQHEQLLELFRRYLLVGGLPDVVNEYLATHNILNVRNLQNAIADMYEADASQYENNASRRLLIRRIYAMIVSQMENKKKRIVAKDIQDIKGDRFARYVDEFEYLLSSAISLGVNAIANPRFPLSESLQKNLLKLYLNDVGLLTAKLYHTNIQPILQNERSINLGAVYESVVAQELSSHGYPLFYYDNRQKGEVDFMIDDYQTGSVLPIEVKSGRDYTIHSALNALLNNKDYGIHKAIVFSNERQVKKDDGVVYMPVYYVMFLDQERQKNTSQELLF